MNISVKRPFFKKSIFFMLVLLLSFWSCSPKKEAKVKAPNIIYILADDLGYGDLYVYNQASKIKTPRLDQLAREGKRFTDMHSTSSVCTPTRYSIITGEYAWRSPLKKGVLWSYGPLMIPDGKETVAKLLSRNNYQTAVIGKWHLGLDWQLKTPYDSNDVDANDLGFVRDYSENIIDFSKAPKTGPANVGFDYSYILPASLDIPPYVYLENGEFTQPINDYTDGNNMDKDKDGDFWRPGPMAEGFDFYEVLPSFISKAKTYIQGAKDNKAPFFLYLPLAAPHTPWVPKPYYKDISEAGMYGAFVSMVDDYIGQLIDYIDQLGLSEETMIVFTSDNGPYWKLPYIKNFNHRAAGNLKGMKGDIYDGGHRIPFIVKWPGKVKAGSISDHPNTLANFYATMADLVGVSSAVHDSHSIYKVLIDENHIPDVKPIIHHSSRGHFAIRSGNWKMIEKWGSGGFSPPTFLETPVGQLQERLYNLEEDIAEVNDLSPKKPKQLEKLKLQLDSIRNIIKTP